MIPEFHRWWEFWCGVLQIELRGVDLADQDNMAQDELRAGFDEWAHTYDQDVGTGGDRFPFAGYPQALETVWEEAQAEPGITVLDLEVGTGNLARLFVDAGPL